MKKCIGHNASDPSVSCVRNILPMDGKQMSFRVIRGYSLE